MSSTQEKLDIYNYFEDRLLRYIGSADSLFGEEIHALLQSLEDDIQALIESAKREVLEALKKESYACTCASGDVGYVDAVFVEDIESRIAQLEQSKEEL